MNLNEAINHAENLAPKNEGVAVGNPGFSLLHYYVFPWNDGYIVQPDSHIKRHPNTNWVIIQKKIDKTIKYVKIDPVKVEV